MHHAANAVGETARADAVDHHAGDRKLAGILTSYDSKDQLSDVMATDIVERFVREAADGDYAGFPSLGISTSRTEDINFRAWLKLTDDVGGLYVSTVRVGSAAEKAGQNKACATGYSVDTSH